MIPFLVSFLASRLLLWLRRSSRKVGWVSEGEGNRSGRLRPSPLSNKVLLFISPSSYNSLYTVCIVASSHRPLHFSSISPSHLFIHSTLVSADAAGLLFVAAEMDPTTPLRDGNRAARNPHDATPPLLRTSPPPREGRGHSS